MRHLCSSPEWGTSPCCHHRSVNRQVPLPACAPPPHVAAAGLQEVHLLRQWQLSQECNLRGEAGCSLSDTFVARWPLAVQSVVELVDWWSSFGLASVLQQKHLVRQGQHRSLERALHCHSPHWLQLHYLHYLFGAGINGGGFTVFLSLGFGGVLYWCPPGLCDGIINMGWSTPSQTTSSVSQQLGKVDQLWAMIPLDAIVGLQVSFRQTCLKFQGNFSSPLDYDPMNLFCKFQQKWRSVFSSVTRTDLCLHGWLMSGRTGPTTVM